MSRVKLFISKRSPKNNDYSSNDYVEYNPQNIETILVKFHRLHDQVTVLENSLKNAEDRSNYFEDLLAKFKTMFNDELTLFKLYKSHIFLLNQTVRENELFIKELDRELKNYFESSEHDQNEHDKEKFQTFKRIILRFFHQNNLCKSLLKQKIVDLNENIEHKNQLLEKIQDEIKSFYNPPSPLNLQKNKIELEQAVSL